MAARKPRKRQRVMHHDEIDSADFDTRSVTLQTPRQLNMEANKAKKRRDWERRREQSKLETSTPRESTRERSSRGDRDRGGKDRGAGKASGKETPRGAGKEIALVLDRNERSTRGAGNAEKASSHLGGAGKGSGKENYSEAARTPRDGRTPRGGGKDMSALTPRDDPVGVEPPEVDVEFAAKSRCDEQLDIPGVTS